jgi:hypothetical protein
LIEVVVEILVERRDHIGPDRVEDDTIAVLT